VSRLVFLFFHHNRDVSFKSKTLFILITFRTFPFIFLKKLIFLWAF